MICGGRGNKRDSGGLGHELAYKSYNGTGGGTTKWTCECCNGKVWQNCAWGIVVEGRGASRAGMMGMWFIGRIAV